ncbi:MAG: sugar isomerase domain-containing protein [Oscillospiraceae bacterium]|nr:sugar isomerase domain-containing protein [Oscillospiraceae bacterium]MBQ2742775.1 sugar isomerase domain-containing protein [Oscillospiraceae bacterium]MBQ3225073.1 sugar isomerase domain-containing protein [Oscillospiraceae bacterium]MBQ6698008.1 sugar isomerase domain-containing protein [Oscillospiraceae bacterium]
MDSTLIFYKEVVATLDRVVKEQSENIEKAATVIADTIQAGGMFHIFGTGGHSNMAAIEMCHRAGNLCCANAILDPGLSCEHGATRWNERVVGYANEVMRYYRVKEGDVMLQINAYGINSVTIDTANYCRANNIPLIAITCPELTDTVDRKQHNRHPSGASLYELADIVINDYTPVGEAIVPIEGCTYKASPASTIINLFIVDSINAKVCEILASRGVKPDVWVSGNGAEGDRLNQKNMDKWFWRLRHI